MKLYWFSDEEGSFWDVIAAQDENRAWELLAACSFSNGPSERSAEPGIPVEEAKESYVLSAVTDLSSGTEGEVASIFPREVDFAISAEPGSDRLGHLRDI